MLKTLSAVRDQEQMLHMGVGYAPLDSRDYIVSELRKYPVARSLILVLKHFIYRHGVNDAYSGGLASHSLSLLVLFFVRSFVRETLPQDSACGELLIRILKWLGEFPFANVGIELSDKQPFFARTDVGHQLLEKFFSANVYETRLVAEGYAP